MRLFRATYMDRNGKRRTAARWYVEFKDHQDVVRRFPAFTDKRASEAFGRQIERLVPLRIAGEQPDTAMTRWLEGLPTKIRERLAAIGLLDAQRVASTKSLRAHLADFEQALADSGATPEYVQKTISRVTAILDGTGAVFLSDLSAAAVSRFLAERRTA